MLQMSIREARSHLRELVDRVAAGDCVSLTRRGREVARLVPPAGKPRRIPSLAGFRKRLLDEGATVTGSTVAKMREEERW
jgi:prevent-host-death family protein